MNVVSLTVVVGVVSSRASGETKVKTPILPENILYLLGKSMPLLTFS